MILNLGRNIYYWAPRSNPSRGASLSRIKPAEYFIDRIDAASIHFQLSAKYFIKFESGIDEFRELIFTMDGVRGSSSARVPDKLLHVVCDREYFMRSFLHKITCPTVNTSTMKSIFNLSGGRKQLTDKLDVLSQSIVRGLNAEVTSIS